MDNIIVIRSPQEIAAEINAIRRRAARQLLEDSVEVGRLLTEAKAAVQHGDWGGWLEENFQYSSTEANNLMRLYEAYGTREQIGLFEEDRTAIFGRMNKSQAVALLGLPESARAAFVEANPPEDLSVREWEKRIEAAKAETDEAVRKAVEEQNARIEAEKRAREAVERLAQADAARNIAEEAAAESRKLKKELSEAKKLAEDRSEAIRKAESERDPLQLQIEEIQKHPPVRELTAEERDALTAEAREDAERAVTAELAALRAENEKLKLAADPLMQKFQRSFEAFREAYASMKTMIQGAGEEKQEKLTAVLRKITETMAEEWR